MNTALAASAGKGAKTWTRTLVGRSPAILIAAALVAACDRTEPTAPASAGGVATQATLIESGIDVPEWVGNLLNGSTAMVADGESTQEELPGMGHKFQLFFAMQEDEDPENLTNDVISVFTTTDGAGIGLAVRNLPPGIRVEALDNQMNLKYLFPDRSCGGGSPRLQISISTDGDQQHDANAFGYVGKAPFGVGCLTGEWDIIDMTDDVGRWDLSQFPGGGMTMTWDEAELFIATTFPNHRVLSGSLVDDSCSFNAPSCGQAYYDLVTMENRTLENHQDAVKK